MNNLKTVVAIAVGSLFAGAAFAQSNYTIEQRDRIQQARIDRGVESGQLTSREADRLQSERAQIERMESRARSDGVMTRNERARVDSMQDRLGRDIRRESHDRQTANSNGHRPYGWDRGNGNGWGRGNDNGHRWGRGNDNGRSYGWGRGDERGYEHGARGGHAGYVNGARGQRSDSHPNGWTSRAGTSTGTTPRSDNNHGWTQRTGSDTRSSQADRGNGRQANMPQAQARSTQSTPRATRPVTVARQGGDSGRRTR